MADSMSSKYYSETKVIKLKTHPRNFCEEDLVVNLDSFIKEKFRIFEGIVIEIFPVDERKSFGRKNHLLLEVRKIPPDVQAKGGPLSISQEVAHAFNLSGLREVCIRRVDKDEVALDLVEFRFKDQGLSRSDMWRFTNSLIDKGMYISRKLLFAGMLLKVSGLWAKGETVKSGVVTDSTRIVFRSASSQFFLFIQVSSEIWEFDPNGDTYFDKAVDGFLKDLFSIWKDKECNHQLTLIFFARKYSRNYTDEMLTDKRGRYYTDYYYVVIQEESRADWSSAIVEVKRSFQCFQELLHPDSHLINGDEVVPEHFDEWISTSAEGNILEATNLAVNVLENHYKNCNFNTTGQQIVIVSPGAGVFEVDNELNRLTKERIIDQGIGMDLICLNEQPLHAVPLFKVHSGYFPEDHYHIPHWINYSYYNPSRPWTQFRYQPRIKISDHLVNEHLKVNPVLLDKAGHGSQKAKHVSPLLNPNDPLALIDYETYDANIFAVSGSSKYHSFSEEFSERPKLGKYSTVEDFSVSSYEYQSSSPSEVLKASGRKRPQRARHHSDNYEDEIFDDGLVRVGSAEMVGSFISSRQPFKSPVGRRKKAFINPFDPTKSHVEVSSHLCRWMHTFPRDTRGRAFQNHHVKELEKLDENTELKTENGSSTSSLSLSNNIPTESLSAADNIQASTVESFASIRRSGMDWTSLTEPACLPLTTDYYPDNYAISRDYVVYNSSLVVSSDDSEGAGDKGVADGWRADHQNINTVQAFKEMISQRLAQGFQLVFHYGSLYSLHKDLDGLNNKRKKKTIIVKFSLGRVFQSISLEFPHMNTCIYKMKTPLNLKEVQYSYKLVADPRTLSDASCGLSHERRENYNWNYLDQHISGHVDFEQYQESHKYWRCRFLVLPSEAPPSDRTGEPMSSWLCDVTSGFIRLVELMNSIKRTSPALKNQKKEYGRFNSMPCRSPSLHSTAHSSPCPSPTVSLSRHRSSREDLSTPSRSNSDSKMKSHEDLRSPGTRSPDLRSPSHHEQLFSSRSPQLSLVSSNSQRSSREIVSDLKELTFGSRQRSTSPNPQRQRRRLKTGSIENLPTAHEEETVYPALYIVPSTPTRIPSNEDDDLSPLDFPDAPLMIGSPPEKVLQALLDRNDGIDLLVNQPPLRNNCFLSMEAVKLLQEKMDGSPTRRDIVTTMQNMLKKGYIVHASGDKRVPFIDGFYFYYAPESSNIEDVDIEYEVFCKKWFEVGINPVKQETEVNTPSHGSSFQSSPYYMHSGDYDKVLGDGSSRFVEFNPDQQSISDRPEWCYIHYRTMYYQTQGYPLEFQWMACTLSLLHKLVQNWTHKAAMCGFNLVPVHSLGVLGLVESTNDQPHPFLNSIVLSFQLPSEYQVYLNDIQDDHSAFVINLFQLILDKLGFLLDPTSLMELGSPDYYWKPQLSTVLSSVFIHHTGVAIVQPIYESSTPGFKWLANNYYLQQKSTSQSVLNKYDELIETFKTLLSNTDELLILCNKAKLDY